jgi:hypothetical protein
MDDFSKLPVLEMGQITEFYADAYDVEVVEPTTGSLTFECSDRLESRILCACPCSAWAWRWPPSISPRCPA